MHQTALDDLRQLVALGAGQFLSWLRGRRSRCSFGDEAITRASDAGQVVCHASERQPRRRRRSLSSYRLLASDARNQRIAFVGSPCLVGAGQVPCRALASRALRSQHQRLQDGAAVRFYLCSDARAFTRSGGPGCGEKHVAAEGHASHLPSCSRGYSTPTAPAWLRMSAWSSASSVRPLSRRGCSADERARPHWSRCSLWAKRIGRRRRSRPDRDDLDHAGAEGAQRASRNECGARGSPPSVRPPGIVHASSGMSGLGWATIRLAGEVC